MSSRARNIYSIWNYAYKIPYISGSNCGIALVSWGGSYCTLRTPAPCIVLVIFFPKKVLSNCPLVYFPSQMFPGWGNDLRSPSPQGRATVIAQDQHRPAVGREKVLGTWINGVLMVFNDGYNWLVVTGTWLLFFQKYWKSHHPNRLS